MDITTIDDNESDESNDVILQRKGRTATGKSLFPWKSRHGPELKRALIKLVYLHGMHLPKGSDRLPNIKKVDDKWKFIAEEFWMQPCCQSLKLSPEFKDVRLPTNLSVRSEVGTILTEVSRAMRWDKKESRANLSQYEGDLPEYEETVKNILIEQDNEAAAGLLKDAEGKQMEQNEVSILLSGLSKNSEAELKVTSKAIRKRERNSDPSPDESSISSNSRITNSFGGKAMHYLDRMFAEKEFDDEEEVKYITKKTVRIEEDGYDTNMEKLLVDMYENNNWCSCLSMKSVIDEENYEIIRAQDIGIEVIINLFIRNVYDLNYFKDEMMNLQLGKLSAHKLYLHLKKSYNQIIASGYKFVKNNAMATNSIAMTPK